MNKTLLSLLDFSLLIFLNSCKLDKNTDEPVAKSPIDGQLIAEIELENSFSSCEKIILEPSDTSNIVSILKVVYPSKDATIVSNESAYIFQFKYRSQSITYKLSVPNPNGATMVFRSGVSVYEDVRHVKTQKKISTATV